MSATCATRASAVATKNVVRACSANRVAALNRAAFFTGAQLQSSRRAEAATVARRGAAMQPVRALFGGGSTATKGGIYDYTVKGIDGKDIKMSQFKGKVLLVINVASACGFTPQYTEMAELHNKYNKDGFACLAFPCNQFGSQEPGSNSEIKTFAERKGFKGPMFAKIDVNGGSAEPLWDYLKGQQGGLLTSDIKWNFTKFLVDRQGNVVKRYGSTTTPAAIEGDIQKLL